MRKILFVGPPGSGKGTQAKLLQSYRLKHISTGALMRDAWKNKDPLLMPYKEEVEEGGFLPDDKIVFHLVENAIRTLGNYKGYVLDGAVRNLNQAEIALEKGLVDEVIYFNLSNDEARKRLISRGLTAKVKRKDDRAEFIGKRFIDYRIKTKPILKYLKSHVKKYYEIDASPGIEAIHNEVVKVLGLK